MAWCRTLVTTLLLWLLFLHTVKSACTENHVSLSYSVQEETAPRLVGNIANQLNATLGPPYAKNFFTSSLVQETFDIDYNTGAIRTKIRLDRETTDSYSFYVEKKLSNTQATICVTVTVTDVNDQSPEFSSQNRTLEIPEGAPHHKVSLVSAVDRDAGANSIAGFRFASGNVDYAFNVTGRYSAADKHKLLLDLGVNGTLDYERTPNYTLSIEVYDGGSPALTSTMQVNIIILDTNDNTPLFSLSKYSAAIYENTTIGTSILEVHATDQDSGENGRITYSIEKNTDPDNCFAIDSETGVITLNKMLDYELKRNYRFHAIASDNGNQSLFKQAVIEIDVKNINELPAEISITYNNNPPRILENASKGYYVARVSVSDPESPDNDNNNIEVTLQGDEGKFALESTGSGTFTLVVAGDLDRETKSAYNLTLMALDSGSPPLSATKSFLLQLDDVNDNAPQFGEARYNASVDEMSEPGSYVLSVSAQDPDIGENARITYSIKSSSGIDSEWFQVDADSGLVTTRGQVDCEVDSHPSFWLLATDHGNPPMSSSVSVTVLVKDVNDKEPTFDTSLYTASVPENFTVSSCILQVNASDPDCGVNGQISYSLAGHDENFSVNQITGWICVRQELDHETHEIYEFSVIATDSGNFATTANVQITVQDINDNAPEFYPRNYSKNIRDSTQPQSEVITVHASDADSGTFGDVTYVIADGNNDGRFAINPDTGTIRVEQSLPQGERVYKLVIDARDGGGVQADQRAEVYISVTGAGYNPPVFTATMYRFSISEDVPNDTFVGTVVASYAGSSNGISYTIMSGDRYSYFYMETGSGRVRTAKPLDHDTIASFLLSVQADTGSTHLFGTTQVNITVEDINDNAPLFTSSEVTTSISEATNTMATIYSAHASDKDSRANGNGEVRYQLAENPNFLFDIDAISGDIHLAQGVALDYETQHQHILKIVAYDRGQSGSLSSSMTLTVNVQDANDNRPVFEKGHFTPRLSENSDVNIKFEQIKATDRDSGENGRITYTLLDADGSDKFGIFPSDGFMYLKKAVDREKKSEYHFTVVARDHGQPSLSSSALVTVYIQDYNDNSPQFSQQQYKFFIEENLPQGTLVGTVSATDADSGNNAQLQYDFNQSQRDFSISSQGVISTTRPLDRETRNEYPLQVTVYDSGSPVLQSTVQVHIMVTDVNDNSPEIRNASLRASVEENQSKGVRVVRIDAVDPDAGANGTITFSLTESSDPAHQDALNYFTIHPTSGWVTTTEVLDYEVKNLYKFKVIATDAGTPQLTSIRDAEITIIDDKRNDEAPTFPSNASKVFYVVENTPIGTLVGHAYDEDPGETGRISYYIVSGNIFGLFSVDFKTGNITTIRDVDFEETSSQTIGIKAIDNSVYNPKSSMITLKIHIIDTNDNAPVFEHDPVFLNIRENIQLNWVIHTFTATDADSGKNGTVMYEIRNQSGDGHLKIDPYTGQLSVARTIDYEQIKEISLIIEARDQAPTPGSQLRSHATVVIFIEDVNDNAPVFQPYQTIKVHEDEPVGYQLVSIIATDADGNVNNSGNSAITYTIRSGNIGDAFHMEQNTGVLTVASPLDREQYDSYTLRISASDHGQPRLTSEMTLTLVILDVNDNAPKFEKEVYNAPIEENSVISKFLIQVSATDNDIGENQRLSYSIADGIADNYFAIDPVTGVITLATSDLDREVKSQYTITVYVQDAGNPVLFDMATINVQVDDVNDNAPTFKESQYFLQIPENLVQDSIYVFMAHDADIGDNAKVVYSIAGGNTGGQFSIDADTGVLSVIQALDRELVADYTLKIAASDGQSTATCDMFVRVQDQNDNDPVFSQQQYLAMIDENVAVGTTVVMVTATDADVGENGHVTYSLHNESDASLFAINASSGLITTKGTFDREKKSSYSFDVEASDGGVYDRRSSKVHVNVTILDVNDNAPVFQEVPYRKNVSQGTSANTRVLTVTADDKDLGKNGIVRYRLESAGNSLTYFSIDSASGEIKTRSALGADAVGYHHMKVIATDGADDPLSTTGVVEVNVGTGSPSLAFKNSNYSTTLQEHAPVNSRVIQVELNGNPAGVTFSFASGNHNDAFQIDGSGYITVKTPSAIDYEENTSMRMIVAAMSGNVFAYTSVWVNLLGINDNDPVFSQERYVTKFYEEQEHADTYVMQVTATDADSVGLNSKIFYNIISGDPYHVFEIDPPHSGIIKTRVIIDYEVESVYKLIIEAKDNGEERSRSSTCTVKVLIIDINDNEPQFPKPQPRYVSEGTEIGTVVSMVTANDVDKSPPLVYSFSDQGNPDGMFSLDRYTGVIRLARELDYETRKHFVIGLQATDGVHPKYTTQEVYVLDENDHAPQFALQSYRVTLEETSRLHVPVVHVNATDADDGENARVSYSLTPSPASTKFYINTLTGEIFTNASIQYQQNQEIVQLVVVATDNGSQPHSAVAAIYIQITSVNKHKPNFKETSYSTTINEDIAAGYVAIHHVEASDLDMPGRNSEIDYFIVGGNIHNTFVIDQKNGSIIVNSPLDRERVEEYNLVVMAKDRGIPPKNSTVSVHIIVQDVNDETPYFEFSEYFVVLNESFRNDTGFLNITTYDKDTGANAKIYYTITSGNEDGIFIVGGSTGELYIMPGASLDYERQSYHKLIVKITDCLGCDPNIPKLMNITTVHVNVTDVNEYSPEFPGESYIRGVNENVAVGSSVFEAHANDKDGGEFGEVEYSLSGTNLFSIHYRTGLVTNNVMFDYESEDQLEFDFVINAQDRGGRATSIPVTLSVMDVDEYVPEFIDESYEFAIPGRATKGTFIGRVSATDQDGGRAGKVYYRLKPAHNYFDVNATTGEILVIHDLNREIPEKVKRRKREVNPLLIEAGSGMDGGMLSSVVVKIDVDRTCAGCEMQYIRDSPVTTAGSPNTIIIIVVVISVVAIGLLAIIIFLLYRRKYAQKTPPPSETPMYNENEDFDSLPAAPQMKHNGFHHDHHDMIHLDGNHVVNLTTSSDMSGRSGSSGRGSAEDDEDEELAMINSSSPSYLNNSNGFRKNMPDSGIQDDDNTSEPSVQNHQEYLAKLGIDTVKIDSKAKSVESMHQFSDSGGGEGTGFDIGSIDYSKPHGHGAYLDHDGLMDKTGMGYHEPEPAMGGALSNVINSEEEYSGSYNWDYLLDWGPQYQPLAHVFSEIARLKDDQLQPKKQAVQIVPQARSLNVNTQGRINYPPPMITNAPPKLVTAQQVPVSSSNRSSHSSGVSNLYSRNSTINTSLPSMPRSPISHESSFTSPALTPSFTPSLSPLATRSPSVSPVNSGRGQVTPRTRGGANLQYGFQPEAGYNPEQELQI